MTDRVLCFLCGRARGVICPDCMKTMRIGEPIQTNFPGFKGLLRWFIVAERIVIQEKNGKDEHNRKVPWLPVPEHRLREAHALLGLPMRRSSA